MAGHLKAEKLALRFIQGVTPGMGGKGLVDNLLARQMLKDIIVEKLKEYQWAAHVKDKILVTTSCHEMLRERRPYLSYHTMCLFQLWHSVGHGTYCL
jgi:hypothetical protein